MASPGFKVMLTALTESDPLRQIFDARFFGIHYRLRLSGSTIEILNAGTMSCMLIGHILLSASDGSIWRGDLNTCIARYTFDETHGYVVTPIENGIPQPEKAKGVHPIDYFFAYWCKLPGSTP